MQYVQTLQHSTSRVVIGMFEVRNMVGIPIATLEGDTILEGDMDFVIHSSKLSNPSELVAFSSGAQSLDQLFVSFSVHFAFVFWSELMC